MDNFQAGFGIIFQEFSYGRATRGNVASSFIKVLWVACSFFLAMAFAAKLKSSFVMVTYEKSTKTMQEMVDKDMPIYVTGSVHTFLKAFMKQEGQDSIYGHLVHQIEKKDTVVAQVSL